MSYTFALQAVNGKYVCAEDRGAKPLIASRDRIGSWETFILVLTPVGKIALQAVNGKYVSAEDGGAKPLIASRDTIGTSESFQLVGTGEPDGRISLRAVNNRYVSAQDNGVKPLIANRETLGTWETFELVEINVALTAVNGKYVCAEDGGAKPLIAGRDGIGPWETFTLVVMPDGKIALQAVNGRYVCAEDNGAKPLVASRDAIGGWETFQPVGTGKLDGKISLRAVNGRYVCAEDGGAKPLIASRDTIGTWETFVAVTFHEAAVRPGKLLVYYGFPSLVNGAKDLEAAAGMFAQYEYVIFGGGIEIDKSEGTDKQHDDHENTMTIIQKIATMSSVTKVFGYIPLGTKDKTSKDTNYTLDEVARRAGLWSAMKVYGIFLDEFGYDQMDGDDRKAKRQRQNDAVDHVHGLGLAVIANGWRSEDLFNTGDGTVSLDARDFYFSESFQITETDQPARTVVQPTGQWRDKAKPLRRHQRQIGFRVLSTTRTAAVADASGKEVSVGFDNDQLKYAWYSALLDGHEAFGWGEPHFCASGPAANAAPFRVRPDLEPRWFTGRLRPSNDPTREGAYERGSDAGTIWVNPNGPSAGP